MRYLRLVGYFIRASAQQELAYRANFFISLLYSLQNLVVGVLGIVVLFGQVETVNGWDFASMLALLAVYLLLTALRNLFISPSLDALAGMDGEVWSGRLDFTILRPIDTQFLASTRNWRLFSLTDLVLALGVLAVALAQNSAAVTPARLAAFALALAAGMAVLYAVLLAFAGLVFWSPGFLFTWLFDGIFQMARYPVGIYPGWLRMVLTWVVPVGLMTTVPAQALSGDLTPGLLAASVAVAALLVVAASVLFHIGLRRYASASS